MRTRDKEPRRREQRPDTMPVAELVAAATARSATERAWRRAFKGVVRMRDVRAVHGGGYGVGPQRGRRRTKGR